MSIANPLIVVNQLEQDVAAPRSALFSLSLHRYLLWFFSSTLDNLPVRVLFYLCTLTLRVLAIIVDRCCIILT